MTQPKTTKCLNGENSCPNHVQRLVPLLLSRFCAHHHDAMAVASAWTSCPLRWRPLSPAEHCPSHDGFTWDPPGPWAHLHLLVTKLYPTLEGHSLKPRTWPHSGRNPVFVQLCAQPRHSHVCWMSISCSLPRKNAKMFFFSPTVTSTTVDF